MAGLRAPQDGVDPRDQLLVVERPRDEVVAAALEGVHAVDRVGPRLAEHDHGHVAVPRAARLALAQHAADLERRRVREAADEHEVGPLALDQLERLAPARPRRAPRSRRSPGAARGTPVVPGSASARSSARDMSRRYPPSFAPRQMSFRAKVRRAFYSRPERTTRPAKPAARAQAAAARAGRSARPGFVSLASSVRY